MRAKRGGPRRRMKEEPQKAQKSAKSLEYLI